VPHLEGVKEQVGRLPDRVIADAGYGNEVNYACPKQQGVESFIKYNTFHLEQMKVAAAGMAWPLVVHRDPP